MTPTLVYGKTIHIVLELSWHKIVRGNQSHEDCRLTDTVYPKKYAHGFVVLCFVVVMQPFIMNSHEVCIHIHQGCFAGTGAIVRLPQCQWSKPDGYGKTGQCITTTKHSKAETVCIFLGIYCTYRQMTLYDKVAFMQIYTSACILLFCDPICSLWLYLLP